MNHDFDVIVIGSGAGGGTFAYSCSQAGKRVLLLERGGTWSSSSVLHDEQAMLMDRKPYDERSIRVNGQSQRLYVGGVLGGSTALYGAALMRPSRDDFHPGKHYGSRLDRSIWDWPVSYEELEPYYDRAEELFSVAGCGDDSFGPLEKPRRGFPKAAIPLQPINRTLMSRNRAHGSNPFRLPLAIDFDRCLMCGSCPGFICPTGARRSSAHLLQATGQADGMLTVMLNAEVERFLRNGQGKVDGVQVRHRGDGRQLTFRARRYALAAGALHSPALLLRSGIDGPLVGRHYMYHLSPIVAGIFLKPTGAENAFVKQVGFADHYLGSKEFAHKLGLIQSLPVPGPLMLAKAAGKRIPAAVLSFLRRRMLPLAGIVEDLPDPANRVELARDGSAEIQHRFAPYDIERGRYLGKLMVRILKRAGAWFCLSRPFPSQEHVAHQCGTLRFGLRPEAAVVGPDGRLFDQPNVFVVDGSVFPTSLGVGPALTIIANALRVADIVIREI